MSARRLRAGPSYPLGPPWWGLDPPLTPQARDPIYREGQRPQDTYPEGHHTVRAQACPPPQTCFPICPRGTGV